MLEDGLWNPCRSPLPARLARHELVSAAWDGLQGAEVWDSHAHLVGNGDSGTGIKLNPRMESLLSPGLYTRRAFFLNAGCVREDAVDRSYVERLRQLLEGMHAGSKLLLFAFEQSYDAQGRPAPADTTMHVPDACARDVARAHAQYFEWVASIHPYRADAVEALGKAAAEGARAVKWLPAAMNIDPASPRCDAFYRSLSQLEMPLITHAGMERAVHGEAQEYGNPLRLRRALEHGVRVVVAHCASMGEDRDIDRGESGPLVESFSLFARLMGEARYESTLHGDVSAITQLNRAGPPLARLLEEQGWHARLLNGSDYPLPGVMPLFSVDYLVALGLLAREAAPVLREIRQYNPLLFDFVLKRHLRSGGKAFSRRVFETRPFFTKGFKVKSPGDVRQ